MKKITRIVVSLCVAVVVAAGVSACVSDAPTHSYTQEFRARPGQTEWFYKADVAELTRVTVSCIGGYDLATDSHRAVINYAALMRGVYSRISSKGTDQDAGIRALNLLKKIHKDHNGQQKLWDDALAEVHKHPDPDAPIPADYR